MQILVFEHIMFSILARPGRGLAASSTTSNRVNSKLFKYYRKKVEVELCYIVYSTVPSDGGLLYSIYHCSMLRLTRV